MRAPARALLRQIEIKEEKEFQTRKKRLTSSSGYEILILGKGNNEAKHRKTALQTSSLKTEKQMSKITKYRNWVIITHLKGNTMATYYFFKLLTTDYSLRDSYSLKLDKMIALMERKLTNKQLKHVNGCVFEGTIPAENNGALARLIQQRQTTR